VTETAGPVAWSGRLGLGLLLVSLCLLGLALVFLRTALAFTGQLGVTQVIAGAFSGLALGGLVAFLAPGWCARARLPRIALLLAIAVLGVAALLRLPPAAGSGPAAPGAAPALLCAGLFAVGGLIPAILVTRFSGVATRVGAWGLLGAGCGGLAALPLLARLDAAAALCVLALPAAAGARCFSGGGAGRRGLAAPLAIAALAVALALDPGPRGTPAHRAAGAVPPVADEPAGADLASLPLLLREAPATLAFGGDRASLRRDPSRYDLIRVVAAPFSLTGQPPGTVEALHEYLEHLHPDGVAALTGPLSRGPLLRMAATVRATLRERGAELPASRVFIAAAGGRATVLVKAAPFTAAEVAVLEERCRVLGFAVLFSPGRRFDADFDELLLDGRAGDDAPPVTDDRPFPEPALRAGDLLGPAPSRDRTGAATPGQLRGLVAAAVACGALVLVLPLAQRTRGTGGGRAATQVAYFAAVGLGSAVVAATLLRRVLTLLGSPSLTVAAGLCVLLAAGGLGSWRAARLGGRPAALRRRCAVLVVVLMLTAVLLPALAELALGASLPLRALAAALVIAPLGYLLGQPSPLGLLLVRGRDARAIPWCWGAQSALSAAGAVAALVVPLAAGYTAALMVGPAAFLVAAVLAEDL
jgi:hypothetical protein